MHQRQRGYSLVELLMVLTLVGITLAIAIPAMGQYMRAYTARVGADELVSNLRLARRLAITRSQPVTVNVSADSYTLPDWNFSDLSTAPPKTFRLPPGCSVVSGTGGVGFSPNGTATGGGANIRIEIALDGEITAHYDVAVSGSGTISVTYTKVTS